MNSVARAITVAAASPLALLTPTTLASTPLTYDQVAADFDFVTIGALGNRTPNAAESPLSSSTTGFLFGSVDYEYRINRTEVTVEQQLEFVRAYEPFYYDDNPTHNLPGDQLTGDWISSWRNGTANMWPPVVPAQYPSSMGFLYAVRYVNWLHNGKVNERWAFETGAYDLAAILDDQSTGGFGPIEPDPGARFWIPSLDEWIKAAYYDPDRYGEGEEGYWMFPHSSDTAPIDDLLPEDGGERNAFSSGDPLPVGSFADVQSPWGLLDMTGGQEEWISMGGEWHWFYKGSGHRGLYPDGDAALTDRLEWIGTGWTSDKGLRLATVVPSPGTLILWSAACCLVGARRRS